MLLVYDSLMGKTEKFAKKTGFPIIKITKGLIVTEPFILVTYTCGRGEVPETTTEFLKDNSEFLKGVASSGHRNWGTNNFCKAGDIISKKYNVPLVLKFEMVGSKKDITVFKEGVYKIGEKFPRVQQ